MFNGTDFNVTWSDVTLSNSSDVNATWFNATWSNVTWSNATSNVTWPRVTWANATLLTRIWSEVSWSYAEESNGSWTATSDTTLLDDGFYTLNVRSTDFAGNVNEMLNLFDILLDNVQPSLSLIAPVPGSYGGDLVLNASSDDGLSGVQTVEFGYSGGEDEIRWIPASGTGDGNWIATLTTAGIDDGSYNVSVRSTDFAGNQHELLNVVEVILDNTPPKFSIIGPVEGNYSKELALILRSSDAPSGVELAEFGYAKPGGEITWFSGHTFDVIEKAVWHGSLNTAEIEDGYYVLSARVTDSAGNQNVSEGFVQVLVDNTLPGVSLDAPADGNYSGDLVFSASSTDDLSKVMSVRFGYKQRSDSITTWFNGTESEPGRWTAPLNTTELDDDYYVLSVSSTDFAGNENLSADVVEVVLDNTLPEVLLIDPVKGAYSGDLFFRASSDDALSGVELVEFGHRTFSYVNVQSSNVTWFNGTYSNVTLSNATWPSISWFEVADSNVTTFNGGDFSVTWDNLTLSNSVDPNATWSNATWSNVTWSNGTTSVTWPTVTWANASLLTKVWSEFTWLNGESVDGFWIGTLNTSSLGDGSYSLNVRSTDFAGNAKVPDRVVEVVIDNTLPAVSLITPLQGAFRGEILFNASSDSGISETTLMEFGYRNQSDPGANITWFNGTEADGYWTAPFDTTLLEDGSYILSLRTTESTDSQRFVENVRVIIVDNTLPNVSLAAPLEGDYRGMLLFNASSDDNLSGVEYVRFSYESGDGNVSLINGTKDADGSWIVAVNTSNLSDGSYAVSVISTDAAGNQQEIPAPVSVIIDNSPPTVDLISPLSGNFSGILDDLLAQSDGGVSKVRLLEFGYALSGEEITWLNGSLLSGGIVWRGTLNTTNLTDGTYDLSVRSTDRAGNQNESLNVGRIVFDNRPPSISLLVSPVAGSYGGNVLINASFGDGASGIRSVEFGYRNSSDADAFVNWIDGSEGAEGYWNATFNTSGLDDGFYNLSVRSTDFLNNQNVSENLVKIFLDNSPPELSFIAPAAGPYSGVVVFNASANDSDIKSVQFGYGRFVETVNESGNVSVVEDLTWFNAVLDADGFWTASLDTRALEDSVYNVSVRSNDSLDNQNELLNVVEITVDNMPPSFELISPIKGIFNGDVLLNVSANDSGTGVKSMEFGYLLTGESNVTWIEAAEDEEGYWTHTLDTRKLRDGTYALSVRSTDFYGNVNELSNAVEILLDNQPPTAVLISPVPGNYSGSVLLNAFVEDNGTGVESVQFGYVVLGSDNVNYSEGTMSQDGHWRYTLNTSVLVDETYLIYVKSRDGSDHYNALFPVTVVIDNSAPDISLVLPLAGNYSGDLLLRAQSEGGLTPVSLVEFGYRNSQDAGTPIRWLNGSAESTAGYWNVSLDTFQLADGSYNISVRSTDILDQENLLENAVEVVLDNTKPSVSLLSPRAGDYAGELVFNALSDGGASDVKLVEFGYRPSGGDAVVTWFNGVRGENGYWNATLNAVTFPDGVYTLSVRSTDFAGNQMESLDIVRVVIDNSAPELSLIAPVEGNYSGELLFSALSDGGAGKVKLVEFAYVKSDGGNVTWINGTEADGHWSVLLDTRNLDEASYNVSVRSVDSLDNRNELLNHVKIIIDNSAPQISLIKFKEGNLSGNKEFSAVSKDGGVGVRFVEFGYSRYPGTGEVKWFNGSEFAEDYNTNLWAYELNTVDFSDGVYNVSVRSTDSAGNQNISLNAGRVVIDNMNPSVSLVAPIEGAAFNDSLNLLAAAADGETGVSLVEFGYAIPRGSVQWIEGSESANGYWNATLSSSSLTAGDGDYLLSVRSTDFAGNRRELLNVVEVTKNSSQEDTTAPLVSLVSPAPGNVSGTLTMVAAVYDGFSSVQKVSFGYGRGSSVTWIDGTGGASGYWSAVLDTTMLTDGTAYNLSINATDSAGYTNEALNIAEIMVDNVLPVVNLIEPVESARIIGELLFNASAQDSHTGVDFVEFGYAKSGSSYIRWFNGTGNGEGSWAFTLDTEAFTEGAYSLSVRGFDFAGNKKELFNHVQVVIDNSAPELSLITPVAGNYRGILQFEASATDGGTGVEFVEFGYARPGGNVTWNSGSTINLPDRWYFNLQTESLEEGFYDVSLRGNDSNDNERILRNVVRITVDNTQPDVELLAPLGGTLSGDLKLFARSEDNLSGVELVEFGYARRGNNPVWVSGTETLPGTWSYLLNASRASLSNGSYVLSVRSTDAAGNLNESLNVVEITWTDTLVDGGVTSAVSLIAPVVGNYSGDLYFYANSTGGVSSVKSVSFGYGRGVRVTEWIPAEEIEPAIWGVRFDTSAIADRYYNISIRSTDFYDVNTVYSDIVEILVDNTVPEVSVVSPGEGTYNGTLLFNASVTDTLSGIRNVSFGYSSGSEVVWIDASEGTDGYWDASLNLDNIADDHYNLSVRAVDYAGAENLKSNFVRITVDNVNPVLEVVSPVEGNYSGDLLFNASANDSGAGISGVQFGYARPGKETTWVSAVDDGNSYWSYVIDTTSLSGGVYELSVIATDFYGRETVSMNFVEIVVDNDKPVLTLIKPESTAEPFTDVLDFRAYSEDRETGVKLVEFGYSLGRSSVTWIPGNEVSPNNWETSVSTTGLADGSYYVSVRSTDFAGNVNEMHDVVSIAVDSFGYDTTPPSVSLEAPVAISGNHTGELAFRAVATDGGSGVKSVNFGYARNGLNVMWIPGLNSNGDEWVATFDTAKVQDGNYGISVNATDRAGHSTVLEGVVRIYFNNYAFDKAPPEILSLVSPVAGNYSGDLLFNASANDSGTGVSSVQFGYSPAEGGITWFDGSEGASGYWNATLDTASVQDGTYNVSVRATDAANNLRVLENVMQIVLDNTAPTVSFLTPPDGGNYSADSIVFVAESSDNLTGVKLVEFGYGIYDTDVFTWFSGNQSADGWNGSIDFSSLEDNSYNVSVRSTDFAGNQNLLSRTIVIDRTAPGVTLIAPVTGNFNGSLTFIASSSDADSGVKLVEFGYVRGSGSPAWHDGTMVAPGYWTASPSDVLTTGVYTLSVRSTDFAGNQNESLDVAEITLSDVPVSDSVAPGVGLVTPVAGSYGGLVELIALSYDNLNEVESLSFGHSRDGGNVTWLPGSVLVPGFWNATLNTALLEDGYYNISVNSTDAEGNENVSSDLVQITVDHTGPVVSFVSPSAGSVSGVLLLNASVSDDSGVKSVEFGYRRSSGDVTWLNTTEGATGYWNASLNTTLLVEDASYDIVVRALDSLDNERLDLDALQITVNNVASSSSGGSSGGSSRSRSRSSGGGGGGGGGGIISTITPTVTAGTTQSQAWDRILAGSNATFKVTKSGIAVSEIRFTVTETVDDTELTITAQPDKPSYVITGYPGIVYQYFTISKSNFEDSFVSSVTIAFSVNRTFISENNASTGDIILGRYENGYWNELETRLTGSDAEYYYYQAVSPGFSSFVIALPDVEEPEPEQPVVVPVDEPVNDTVEPVESEQPGNASVEELPETKPVSPDAVDPTRGALVTVIIVVAGLTAYLLYRRSRRKSQYVKGFVYPKSSHEKDNTSHSEAHSHSTKHHPKQHHKDKDK